MSHPNPSEWLLKHRRELEKDLPSVCVLHGQPGIRTAKWHLPSHPHIPWDDYSLRRKIVHEIVHHRSETAHSQRRGRRIRAESRWALCPLCRQYLRRRRLMSALLLVLMAIVITTRISPLSAWVPEPFLTFTLIGGIALFIPAMRCLNVSPEITRAQVSEDGTALHVHNPHAEFAREAIAMGAQWLPELTLPTNMYGLRPIM